MAKGKAKKQAAGSTTAAATSDELSILPSKPPRMPGTRAPGIEVELFTNLFKISVKFEKPIFCYTIQIDCLTESTAGDKAAASDDATHGKQKQPALPRKIPKDLRLQAVKRAIGEWLENNKPKLPRVAHNFVLDANASTMYALFQMMPNHDGSPGTRQHMEIKTFAKSPYIQDKKSIEKEEPMVVRIYSPTPVDVRALVDHCAGKKPRASVEVEATLKALNTILTGKILTAPGYFGAQAKAGSCSVFPFKREQQFEISKGIFCNRGFITSVRPTEIGLVANIANTVAPFYEPSRLTRLLQERYNVRDLSKPLPAHIIDELKRELKTKQVEAIHINYGTRERPHYRKYRIHDIGNSTNKEMFDWTDSKTGKTTRISVAEYFKKEYPGCQLSYPNLPVIVDNKRKIPLEICQLVEKQRVNRKMNPEETSQVIRKAAMKPDEYFRTVQNNTDDLIKQTQPFTDFGLEIERKLIELKGRELPAISLWGALGPKKPMTTFDGAYNNTQASFVKAAKVERWALVVLIDSYIQRSFKNPQELQTKCQNFSNLYCNEGRKKGVQVPPLAQDGLKIMDITKIDERAIKTQLRKLFESLNDQKFAHAVIILPLSHDWIYSYLQYLEVDVPSKRKVTTTCTRSSCVKAKNFVEKILFGDRGVNMFLANLWLKYNTKLGGINIALSPQQNFSINPKEFNNFLDNGWLFVSIDVCHPAPGDRLEQSVAAAVGLWGIASQSMASCTRVRVQRKDKSEKEKSTVEQVGEIGVMFGDILESYKQQTGGKAPTHIVVLRDGVSEGQFQMVLRFELSQIRTQIANFYTKLQIKKPLLTCLTVQKRHRTRFMRKRPVETRRGPDYNIQPGTVVDNTIVEPMHHSFYLAPHKAIQGTARAPHIYMIFDEINFSQDSAQAMIFALSYLSPRCTKGTSIPTPVNLADLAAERGKNIVVSWNEDNIQVKMTAEERLIKLNAFLSNMGDPTYQNTLYYV